MLSEDYDWNKKYFGSYSDVLVMKPEEAIDDFCLLVNCDELILSAGSYSWWAGYLNGGPLVISALYARKNSALASQMSNDYYLPSWTVL